MWRLSPVMSWMFITFHSPEASGVHAMSQLPPAWKTCPGLGVEGVGSASTAKAKDKTKAVRAPRENIVGVLGEAKKEQKMGGRSYCKRGGATKIFDRGLGGDVKERRG